MEDWALKYRPQKLTELVGQDVNKEILTKLLSEDRLYNAMIFYGRSGCGKTTTARILANEMDAEIVELDAASNNGVDDAREIKEIASRLALTGKHKIIVIDEAHMLSKQAWNALLKVIEEPNSKTHFVFCTTEYSSVPLTIRGRSQMFKFYSIPQEVLYSYASDIANKERCSVPEEVLRIVVKESKGQVRDLLKLLQVVAQQSLNTEEKVNKYLAVPPTAGMGSFIMSVLGGQPKNAIKVLKGLEVDYIEWVSRLRDLVYEILEDKFGIKSLPYTLAQSAKLRALGESFEVSQFGKLLDAFLRITKPDQAYSQLYTLSVLGVR